MAGYNRCMEENFPTEKKEFFVDGLENGDPVYNTTAPLTTSSDAAPAVFAEDLQRLLDEGSILPNPNEFTKIEEMRAGLLEYQRKNAKLSVPSHNLLDDKSVALGSFSKKRVEEVTEQIKYKSMEDAVLNLLKGKKLSKDELVTTVMGHQNEISPEYSRTRVAAANTIDNLLKEKKIFVNQKGVLSLVMIAGGSTNFPDQEKSPNQPWSMPSVFEDRFQEVLGNEHNPTKRRGIITFHKFDMEIAGSEEDLKKRLLNAKQNGVFSPTQYNELLSVLNREEIISGELPYPDGFVAEPPPVIEKEEVLEPVVAQKGEVSSMLDGVRIGTENWTAQNLEDEKGNKIPLTPENYIRSIGGVMSEENIQEVKDVLDTLVSQGIATVNGGQYQVMKKSRITKPETREVQENAFHVPSSLISRIENLADAVERPVPLKTLAYSLKQDGVTKEQAIVLINTCLVIDESIKNELIGLLTSESVSPEPPPVYVAPPVFPEGKNSEDLARAKEKWVVPDRTQVNSTTATLKPEEVPLEILDTPEPPPIYEDNPDVFPVQGSPLKSSQDFEKEKASWLVPNRTPVPPPIVEQEEIIPEELPYPDGFVAPPPPIVENTLDQRMSYARAGAQPYEISENTFNQFGQRFDEPIGPIEPAPIITPEAQVLPLSVEDGTIDPDKTGSSLEHIEKIDEEVLRETLRVAREVFAKEESEYKQKIRTDKKGYQKIMADLGVPGKQRELSLPTQHYLEAEKAYRDASRALKNSIAGKNVKEIENTSRQTGSIIERTNVKRIDVGVMEQEETERRVLKQMVEAGMPVKERGIVTKAFEKWSSYPLAARVALSATLLTLVTGGVGTVGGTLAAITLRTTRSLVGVGGAMKAATAFDGIRRSKIEEKRKKAFEEYATIGNESEEEKDKKIAQYLEAEDNQIKRDRVTRTAIATVVGGITAAGTGMAMNAAYDAVNTGGVKINPDTQVRGKGSIPEGTKPKSSWLDKLVKKDPAGEQIPAPKVAIPEKIIETPAQSAYVTPVEVDLSNKGFIDTIDKLKQASTAQPLTPALEKLFAQSPQKIAMDLGLFKPTQVAESAFGFQGEQLAIDAEGNVSFVHNSGATEVLMDSKGVLKPFAGKMFDADNLAASPVLEDSVPVPKVAEVLPPAPKAVVETVEKTSQNVSNVEIGPSVPKTELTADIASTTASLIESKPRPPLDFEQTVVRSPEYTGPLDMISGKMPLKTEYQFDPKYKPERLAYNIQLEKAMLSMPSDMVDLRFPIEYNGGRINVFQKGNDILILLNGQKIGTGLIIDGQPGLQYEKNLGTGIFGVKTDFEKAFEEASKGIMKNKMFFKKK